MSPRNYFAELSMMFAKKCNDAEMDAFMEAIDLYAYECHENGRKEMLPELEWYKSLHDDHCATGCTAQYLPKSNV